MPTRERTTSYGISVAILCGGMSRRFGSEKALEMAGERPLCHWLLERLSAVTDDLFLQMAPGATPPADLPAFTDPMPGGGPKSGIQGALLNSRHPRVFVVGSDMPNVDPRLPTVLLGQGEADAVVPRWDNGWIEPLCSLYSSTVLPTLVAQMGEGRLRMRDLLDDLDDVIYVRIEPLVAAGEIDGDCFVNINSRDELDTWLERVTGSSFSRGGPV